MYKVFKFRILAVCFALTSTLLQIVYASEDQLSKAVVADVFGRQIFQIDIDSCHLPECMIRRLQTEIMNGYIDVHGLALTDENRKQLFDQNTGSDTTDNPIKLRLERSLAQRQNQLALSRDKLESSLHHQLEASRARLDMLRQQQDTSSTFQFNLSRLAEAIAAQESFLARSNWEALERYRLHRAIDELRHALAENIDPAQQLIENLYLYRRFSEHLHSQYGGYVKESMFGPEPVEAMFEMMVTERTKGRINMFTPAADVAFEQLLVDLESSLNVIKDQCEANADTIACSKEHRSIYR